MSSILSGDNKVKWIIKRHTVQVPYILFRGREESKKHYKKWLSCNLFSLGCLNKSARPLNPKLTLYFGMCQYQRPFTLSYFSAILFVGIVNILPINMFMNWSEIFEKLLTFKIQQQNWIQLFLKCMEYNTNK